MDDIKKLQFSIIRTHVITLCLLSVISIIFIKDSVPIVKGFAFGGSIGVLNFLLLGNTIVKALKKNPHSASVFVKINYIVRYLILGIVLIVSVKAEYINTISVIIGLLSIKYIIFIIRWKDKKVKKITK